MAIMELDLAVGRPGNRPVHVSGWRRADLAHHHPKDVMYAQRLGGTAVQKNDATSCSHLHGGIYACPLNATDTNTSGRFTVMVNVTGALPVHEV